MKESLVRYLVTENPMCFEATRTARRFFRTGGDTGRGVNAVVLGIIGVVYLWCLVAVFRYKEDWSFWLGAIEMLLVTLVVPASMYAAVSGEREKLTWDALIMTRLTPAQIVAGKALWRMGLVAAIVALFLPPLVLSHVVGATAGNSAPEFHTWGALFASQALILCWGWFLAGFSLWVSAATKRTATTLSLLAAGLLGFLVIAPMLVGIFGGNPEIREHPIRLLLGSDDGGDSAYYQYALRATPMEYVGSLVVHLNPVWRLACLAGADSNNSLDFWRDLFARNVGVDSAQPLLWLGGTALFLWLAWRRLRGMELPGQKAR
jgi:ABC-type transport system involved in multi-copper enzyme maturation permease subunit